MGARGRRMACEEHDAVRNNRTILDLMRQMSRTDGEHTDTGPYPTPSATRSHGFSTSLPE
jgi:hypothetical protein